jgi:hypothetical protein
MHKSFFAGLAVGAAVVAPALLSAGALTLPNTFVNGTVADADTVNANFSAVDAEVDDNASRLAALEAAVATQSEAVSVSNPFGGVATTLDITYVRVGDIVTASVDAAGGVQTSGRGGSSTVTMDQLGVPSWARPANTRASTAIPCTGRTSGNTPTADGNYDMVSAWTLDPAAETVNMGAGFGSLLGQSWTMQYPARFTMSWTVL